MLVGALGAAVAAASQAPAAFPGANGVIAFDRANRATNPTKSQIFTIRPDGSGLRQLTHTGRYVYNRNPAFSADGARIVFVRTAGRDAIVVMNADGSHAHAVYRTDGILDTPSFSPSGRTIVFTRASHRVPLEIYVMRANGTHVRRLTRSATKAVANTDPEFSPDGRTIAFAHGDLNQKTGSSSHIYVMRPDGSHAHRLARVQARAPSFSPDGSEIVFVKNPASRQELAFMNADGTNVHEPPCRPFPGPRPLCVPVSASIPVFSPDGTKIADSGGALVMMNRDGSGEQRLTQTSRSPAQIGWQPLPQSKNLSR